MLQAPRNTLHACNLLFSSLLFRVACRVKRAAPIS